MKIRAILLLLPLLFLLPSCSTVESQQSEAHKTLVESIKAEQPGDYFIGRRVYKKDYKFWGYVRQPGQQWSTSKLVMLNEQKQLAPDRAVNHIGNDNNYEYKLYGKFSGETVYEPASNGFYPEFVLEKYELISVAPAPIFHTAAATDPDRRVIGKPY